MLGPDSHILPPCMVKHILRMNKESSSLFCYLARPPHSSPWKRKRATVQICLQDINSCFWGWSFLKLIFPLYLTGKLMSRDLTTWCASCGTNVRSPGKCMDGQTSGMGMGGRAAVNVVRMVQRNVSQVLGLSWVILWTTSSLKPRCSILGMMLSSMCE